MHFYPGGNSSLVPVLSPLLKIEVTTVHERSFIVHTNVKTTLSTTEEKL